MPHRWHSVAREHTLSQLKELDIGYGYTADCGKSFPFRGKSV
jgi:glycerophosphoryl diester phosphodiesterase